MKHSKRILAYSALALIVMLAAFGAITFDSSNVAYAQTGTVPAAPTLTATSSGPNSITITWDAVPSAVSYELWSWDNDDGWQRLDGGADDPPVLLTGTSFDHTGLMSGKTYYYQMQAFDSDGDPSGWSDRVNEVAGDAPDPPVLTPAAGYEQITVSWPAVTDAVSYELHAWDGNWVQLADANGSTVLTATSYTHTGLTAGSTIYYQGRSVNAGGTMSAWSVQVNATVLSAPTTGAPQSLTAAASGNGEVTLTWTAPADDGGLGIDGYHYQYGETGNLGGDWKDAGDVLTVTISNLTNGTAYDFEVRAFNSGGNGPAAMVSAMPVGGSGALQSLAAVATSHNMVTLTWTAPSDTGGLAITGYDYRSYETGGTPPDAWEDAGDVLTVDVTGLTKNTDYTFEVRAMNSAGSGPAATATATTLREPDAPATLTAASGNGQVTLTWTAPANDGGLAVTGYEYRSYETGGTVPDTWEDAGNVLTVDVTGLTNRTEYTFEVRAVNLAGPGAEKPVTQTPSSKPGAPQNLTATGGPGNITLSWDAPADDGGSAIVNYRIEKYNATSTNWGHLRTVSDTTEEYTDPNVTIGATTEYRVRAINANTNDPSDWATASGVAQGRGVPGAPTELEANRGDGSISYTWEAPTSDGGTAIIRYEYRHFENAGTVPDTWTSANLRTGVAFPNLDATETYDFQVRAVNAVGAGPMEDLEDTPAATTPSLPRRFQAQADNDDPEIELSWDDPIEDGGVAVVGYHLQVRVGSDGNWTDADTFEGADTNTDDELTLDELTYGETYYYRIRAINAHSTLTVAALDQTEAIIEMLDELEWAEANATVASNWPAQVAPVPVASFRDGRITVTWTKPNDHGQPITSYRLRWMSGDEATFPAGNVVEVQAPALEYIMIGPAAAIDFAFQVLAVNSLTDEDEIDNTVVGDEDDDPIKWSVSSTEVDVPAVDDQDTFAEDNANGLRVVPASDGRATITWRMERDLDSDQAVEYSVASYDLEWIHLGPPEGSTSPPTTLAIDADDWDDATSENLAAQALMQRIIGPLPGNTSLFVRVRVVSTVGTKSAWQQAAATTITARAPDHPELTATIIGQNVILSWDEPESNGSPILRYELQFKKDDGDFGDGEDSEDPDNDVITISQTTSNGETVPPATSYSHEDLDGGATYTYRIRTVTACNDDMDDGGGDCNQTEVTGSARKWSDEVVAMSDAGPPADPVVPGTPDLTATPDNSDGTIDLEWEKPSEGTSPITSYQLQRWNGSAWEALPASLDAQDDEYSDETAELGKMYYYAIRAVSNAGMGEWTQRDFPSAMLNAEAPAKIDLSLDVSGQAITLSWATPENNGASIAAYQIQVTTTGPIAADGTTVDEGNRDWGNGTTNDLTISPTPALATTYTHSGLTPGRTYYFRIRAVNACNDADAADAAICGDDELVTVADADDWSDEEDVTTAPIAPSAPGSDTGDFGGSNLAELAATGGDAEVMLTWDLPGPDSDFTDGEHVGVGGAHITSVEIQRWNTSTAQWDDIKDVEVGFVDDEETPLIYNPASEAYTDPGLEDGTSYTYRVRAVNSAGASGWSNMISATTQSDAPDTPTLRATVSGQDVVLNWNTPDANGESIMRYEIQRFPSISADNTNTPPDTDSDPDVINDWGDDAVDSSTAAENDLGETSDNDVIVPMPAGVTTHTDRGLQPGTTYYYRIRAVNVCNDDEDHATNDNDCSPDDDVADADRTWSTDINVTTAPMAPDKMTLTLAGGANMITLSWTAPANNGSTISEYEIERWNSVDRQWDPLKDDLPVSVLSYVDDGLAAETRYFYRIRAVNAGGNGAWSTLTSAVTDDAE